MATTKAKKPAAKAATKPAVKAAAKPATKVAKKPVADPVSEKRERFLDLSAKRSDRIIKAIDTLGNLSGPAYEWSNEEVTKMFGKVMQAAYASKARFEKTRRWKAQGKVAG